MTDTNDPKSCLGIPDWALARAYRFAVDDMDIHVRQDRLIFASNITTSADRMADDFNRSYTDYMKTPRALAEWMRRHFRSDWDNLYQRIPELIAIYNMLLSRKDEELPRMRAQLEQEWVQVKQLRDSLETYTTEIAKDKADAGRYRRLKKVVATDEWAILEHLDEEQVNLTIKLFNLIDSMIHLHDERGTVLTVHMNQLKDIRNAIVDEVSKDINHELS